MADGTLLQLPWADGRLLLSPQWHRPTGSVKERPARFFLEGVKPGTTVIEASSGNMALALAELAAQKACRCILVLPDGTPQAEKLGEMGAQVVLTPAHEGMAGAIRMAQQLHRATPGSLYTDQFHNPRNALAHYRETGPEILAQAGSVDFFVAGVGTGGTLAGAGRYLKENCPGCRCIGVLPAPGEQIAGIGARCTLALLSEKSVDRCVTVTAAQARRALEKWNLGAGLSAGAAVYAAQMLATPENKGKTIVALLASR